MDAVRDPRHEAHRRQERQRRDQRQLRPRRTSSSGASTCSTPTTARWPRPPSSAPARSSAADGKTAQIPDPSGRREVVQRRRLEGPLHPDRRTRSTATCSTRATSSQSGNLAMNESHSWFTCCVNPAAPAKPNQAVRLRGRAGLQRHDHGQAPRRHVQPPQDHQVPGRRVQGPDRPRRLRLSCSPSTARMPADPASSRTLLQDRSTSNFPGIKLDWYVPQAMLAYPDIPNHQS